MAETPQHIGRYEVVAQLATGGMAEILLGRIVGPNGFERPVVIKRILPHLARVPNFVDMFLDEARIIADIRHPNVVQVHELGREDDELFLVMEYLEGETASALMKRMVLNGKGLPVTVAAHVVAELCAGLHAAHELTDSEGRSRGLVHRDVSPQNLFITYTGTIKLLDFGIAKAGDRITRTEAGQIKGKFEYMSPEQCMSKPLDRRADIFATGILLYELSTGKRLFRRDSPAATIKAIFSEFPAPSLLRTAYPAAIERVCLKALSAERDARYATAAEMRRDLLAALRTVPVEEEASETLSTLMRTLFGERMSDKEEMLRKLRLGGTGVHVPVHDTDSALELPSPSGIDGTDIGSAVAPRFSSSPKASSRAWVVAAGALIMIASIALWFHSKQQAAADVSKSDSPPPIDSALVSASPSASTPAPVVIAPAPTADPSVVVRVESAPTAAHVFLGTEDQGTTPLDLHFAKASSAVSIELRHPGFSPQIERLTPDSNQRIRVALSRAASLPTPSRQNETPRAVATPAPTAKASTAVPTTGTTSPPTSGFTKFN